MGLIIRGEKMKTAYRKMSSLWQNMNNPSGGNIWTDGKEKPESAGPSTWNVDIFVQVVKDLVSWLPV